MSLAPPRIYLDYNATAPARPEVIAAVAGALADLPGNPSSVHGPGRAARAAVDAARREVAALIGAAPDELVFTSGGTEGNHLAIRGLARAAARSRGGRCHVLSSPIEHPSVHAALEALGPDFDVSFVEVGPGGEITPAVVWAGLRPETVLVSLAAANHELGNAYDVAALAAVARAHGALFHTDAVQAAGKVPVDVRAAGVDAATLSAHKLGGPKGVGAIYVRGGVEAAPLLGGGHQEQGRRAGTENVPGIAGFAAAARLAGAEPGAGCAGVRIASLRDRLQARLLELAGARVFGDRARRVPGTLSVGFAGVPGHLLAAALDVEGVSVSTGAACASGSLEPSPVLLALGLPAAVAAEAVRLSLGAATTAAEIDAVAALVGEIAGRLRGARAVPRGPAGRAGRERVLVAMSGGVDSSTAAALLAERGFDVVGATLKLYDAPEAPGAAPAGGRCCTPADIRDARATAAALGFPHYVLDERAAFSAFVIDDFVAAHGAGRTPNPCVRCNERLKFGPLLAFADAIGATALATGHYARLVGGAGAAPALARAVDREKDQSYFLFGVRPELLARVRFPLGDMTKDQVRAEARRLGLPNADKPDSQQICFIPDGDHKAFVEARGGAGAPGTIVDDASGAVLADHGGTHRFTIGQRRGVPGGAGVRRFVLRIDPDSGQVRVGPRDRLARTSVSVADVRWLQDADRRDPLRCQVQIRHHAPAAPAWLDATADGTVHVRLDTPAYGVAPGQAAVFYDDHDQVLGGGWIVA